MINYFLVVDDVPDDSNALLVRLYESHNQI
jgi:hypothetical protein